VAAANPDPLLIPCVVVGMTGTAPVDGGVTVPATSGGARSRTIGLADEEICWIALGVTGELSESAVPVAGTSEAVDPPTPPSGTLPETDWAAGNDG